MLRYMFFAREDAGTDPDRSRDTSGPGSAAKSDRANRVYSMDQVEISQEI
ncbi:hypothetical protein SAMN06264867_11116 [Halorubrum cibi]|uniref:Uncharacterized protein n=1 Tax=Halorubrum cibi TaxID=413815 RepID=A0A521EIC2_9EURY|nr:hypothetical protein SAMN06264867_11116 [Halorubrum cibi]